METLTHKMNGIKQKTSFTKNLYTHRDEKKMEKKYPTIIQKIIDVTPQMASKWLSLNNNNRPFKEEKIEEYAEQMRKGLWVINNDDICLDYYGYLNNGQHRLSAVVKCGLTIKMSFKLGLNPNVFSTMDCGKVRTSGNALDIAGIKNGNEKSAIIKFYLQFKVNKFFIYIDGKHRPQHNDILNYALANRDRLEEVYKCTKSILKGFGAIRSAYLGAFYWKFSDINQESANDFFEKYRTGLGLHERHPIYVLRRKLMEDATSMKKVPFANKILWVVQAWNFYREGKSVSNFRTKYKKGDIFPKPI